MLVSIRECQCLWKLEALKPPESWVIAGCQPCVLGIKIGYSGRAGNALNHWATSLVPPKYILCQPLSSMHTVSPDLGLFRDFSLTQNVYPQNIMFTPTLKTRTSLPINLYLSSHIIYFLLILEVIFEWYTLVYGILLVIFQGSAPHRK